MFLFSGWHKYVFVPKCVVLCLFFATNQSWIIKCILISYRQGLLLRYFKKKRLVFELKKREKTAMFLIFALKAEMFLIFFLGLGMFLICSYFLRNLRLIVLINIVIIKEKACTDMTLLVVNKFVWSKGQRYNYREIWQICQICRFVRLVRYVRFVRFVNFRDLKKKRTDGRTDRRTDGQTLL